MSKMITLIKTFAVMCVASAAAYQPPRDSYNQPINYQGQLSGASGASAQQHVFDFQQQLQQTQAPEFQGLQQQPLQNFQTQSFQQQNQNDVNRLQQQPLQNFQPQGFQQQSQNDVNRGFGQNQVRNPQGDARILNYQFDTDEFNNYQYAYETDNGIRAQEIGSNSGDGIKASGAYSYTGDDGQVYTVTYTADENGFRPSGAHLPTPPPIPEVIARSIEKNLQDEANGIFDDGRYNPRQQSEQYPLQTEQKPQLSIAPKKYRPRAQVKDTKQQQPTDVQRPLQQIVVQQPRSQNKPQQVQNQFNQQTQNHVVQQTQQKAVQQPQVAVQRPQHISFNSQDHLQLLQRHEPAKNVVKQNSRHQQRPTASHQQISQTSGIRQTSDVRQNVDSSHQLQGGFVPKYEVKEQQYEVQNPEIQKQQIIKYNLPAAQNTGTEERHKVEFIVPMKQFLEQFKPDREPNIVYGVPVPTHTQAKLAQDYIGPAPVADYHYQQL